MGQPGKSVGGSRTQIQGHGLGHSGSKHQGTGDDVFRVPLPDNPWTHPPGVCLLTHDPRRPPCLLLGSSKANERLLLCPGQILRPSQKMPPSCRRTGRCRGLGVWGLGLSRAMSLRLRSWIRAVHIDARRPRLPIRGQRQGAVRGWLAHLHSL